MHKDEKQILNLINREKDIYFNDLLKLSDKKPNDLDEMLDVLALQSKIKIKRELIDASWTKHITSIEEIEVEVKEVKINKNQKDYIWNMFSKQPCFICPFWSKCNDTNMDQFNPYQCPWLTEWVEINLAGEDYNINFDEIKARLHDI
ncbi:MAG: hypothetical protein ACXAC5_06880 [Promethearchaeota archaeon]